MKAIVPILCFLISSSLFADDIEALKAKAEKGDAKAQFQLAEAFYYGKGVERDYAQFFKWASRSAAKGNPKAKYRLGALYFYGSGVAKDADAAIRMYKEAAEDLRKEAEAGDVDSQFFIGRMYSSGRGVKMDLAKALVWYRKAAERGHAVAQTNLGGIYQYGKGSRKVFHVEKDETEAVKWYRKAAEQSFPGGQYKLGVMYQSIRQRS